MKQFFTTRLSRKKFFYYLVIPVILIVLPEFLFGGGWFFGFDLTDYFMNFQKILIKNSLVGIPGLCYISVIFSLSIRRLHDINKSGWFSLFLLIPVLRFLFILYLLLTSGEKETNKWGDPV